MGGVIKVYKYHKEVNLMLTKNKKILLIALGAVFLIAAAFSSYFLLVNNRSPRQFYLEAEARNFKKYADGLKGGYRDFYESQKPYMESNYKSRLELTADISSESDKPFGIANSKTIFDLLRKSKLIVDSNYSPKGNKSFTNLSLLLEKSPFIDAAIFTDSGRMGFTLPIMLPDTYFTFNTDRLGQVYDRYFTRYKLPPIKPERLIKKVDIAKEFKFSDGEFDNIIKEYGDLISESLEEQDVKFGRDVPVSIAGTDYGGRELIITLNEEKSEQLFRKLTDKISTDSVLLKLTYGNYAGIIKMLDEAGFFQLLEFMGSQGSIKDGEALISKLKDIRAVKDTSALMESVKKLQAEMKPGELKMVLIVDNKGNILDRNVSLAFTGEGNAKSAFEIHSGTSDLRNDGFKNSFCTLKFTQTSADNQKLEQEWNFRTNITPSGAEGNEKGRLELGIHTKKNETAQSETKAVLDLDKAIDELTLKENTRVNYDIQLLASGSEPDTLKGEINTSSWKNNKRKTRNSNTVFTITAEMPSQNLKKTSVKLGLVKEDRLDIGDFDLPQITDGNSVDLIKITDAELIKVENRGLASFGIFYLKNKSIVDAFLQQR
ncbi:MAG: hypothetical protein N2645_21075 [Clostridia bacterium]|nr:hypothetical protein [Clostridia bacterium]